MEDSWREKVAIVLIGLLFVSSSFRQVEAVEAETSDEYEATGRNLQSKFISDAALKEKNLQSTHKEIETIGYDRVRRRNLLSKFISDDTMKKNKAIERHLLRSFSDYFKGKKIGVPTGRKLLNKYINYDAMKKNKARAHIKRLKLSVMIGSEEETC